MGRKAFYLKSKRNQLLYPPKKYPLTHSVNYHSVKDVINKEYDVKFIYLCLCISSLMYIVYMTFMHETHLHMQHLIYGPKHLNLTEFIKHVQDFEEGWYFTKNVKYEYIQVELGENYIETNEISQYSQTGGQNKHISTYKKLKNPKIYVKLPTKFVKHFHTKLPFDFSQFSLETLKCIFNTLHTQKFVKHDNLQKSDFVNFIEFEYLINTTFFNMMVLTKCGIFIGYLYRPTSEKTFKLESQNVFESNDIALETSRPYFSFVLIFCIIIYSGSIIVVLFSYIQQLIIIFKYNNASFPLQINDHIKEHLLKLEFSGPLYKKLLKLDEAIHNCQDSFNNQIFIINGGKRNEFVVFLGDQLNQIKIYDYPFIIIPLSDIHSVTPEKIYYWEQNFYMKMEWSTMFIKTNKKYPNWIHEKLMQKNKRYRDTFERPKLLEFFRQEEKYYETLNPILFFSQIHPEWFAHLGIEIVDYPVPVRLIAQFRLQQSRNPSLINKMYENEKCMICENEFVLNEIYAIWPCGSIPPHIFHFECILERFRTNNKCPVCREKATF